MGAIGHDGRRGEDAMGKRLRLVLALVSAVSLSSGCVTALDKEEPVIMDVLMLLVGAQPVTEVVAQAQNKQKLETELTVPTLVTIGGLSGTYQVALGTYGVFSGTAKVIGQRNAKLVQKDTPELLEAVRGMLADATATDVTVSTAKLTLKGKQTTGGVNKRYKGKIKFKGTVASGASAGATAKGKITTAGDLED